MQLNPSHVSPLSTTPFPQNAGQSVSLRLLQPLGQQPSPFTQVRIEVFVHTTLHVEVLPVRVSFVHALPSLHVAGHVPSHFSPAGVLTIPSPHTTGVQF